MIKTPHGMNLFSSASHAIAATCLTGWRAQESPAARVAVCKCLSFIDSAI